MRGTVIQAREGFDGPVFLFCIFVRCSKLLLLLLTSRTQQNHRIFNLSSAGIYKGGAGIIHGMHRKPTLGAACRPLECHSGTVYEADCRKQAAGGKYLSSFPFWMHGVEGRVCSLPLRCISYLTRFLKLHVVIEATNVTSLHERARITVSSTTAILTGWDICCVGRAGAYTDVNASGLVFYLFFFLLYNGLR